MENAPESHKKKSGNDDFGADASNRGGGTVSFEGGTGDGDNDHLESLLKSNPVKPSRTRGSLLKQSSSTAAELPEKTEEIKAKFRRVSYGDNPPPTKPAPAIRGGLESTNKIRAGAESLGATKAPDWTRHIKDSKRNIEVDGRADEQWRVYLNDDVKNFQEQSQSKSRGILVARNAVSTSKYTFYNFLFLNLGQQFSRLANVYFLIIAVLQLFTTLSPTGRFSTAAPLSLVRKCSSFIFLIEGGVYSTNLASLCSHMSTGCGREHGKRDLGRQQTA